jgi:hypothetical protein
LTTQAKASVANYDHNSSILVLATVITIVNYNRKSFIIQATGVYPSGAPQGALVGCKPRLQILDLAGKDWQRQDSIFAIETSGLYYKPMTIVNDDSRVVNKLEASPTDEARVVIYNRHKFIVQATEPDKST